MAPPTRTMVPRARAADSLASRVKTLVVMKTPLEALARDREPRCFAQEDGDVMPDDLENRENRSRGRINVQERFELKHWMNAFECSEINFAPPLQRSGPTSTWFVSISGS